MYYINEKEFTQLKEQKRIKDKKPSTWRGTLTALFFSLLLWVLLLSLGIFVLSHTTHYEGFDEFGNDPPTMDYYYRP